MNPFSLVFKKIKKRLKIGTTTIRFIRRNPGSFLQCELRGLLNTLPDEVSNKIEAISAQTNQLGSQPLWKGYMKGNESRTPAVVRTQAEMGRLYKEVVKKFKPQTIVEFGTAFGVSGMYWLSGLESNAKGELLTFEPNEIWAKVARGNLSAISCRFTLTIGTFEDNIRSFMTNGRSIDIAFIDAIHTRDFVVPQLEIVLKYCSPHALIFLDDINFSEDMNLLWKEISVDPRFFATASIGDRVGVLEYKK